MHTWRESTESPCRQEIERSGFSYSNSILIGQRRSSPESPCRQEIERSGFSYSNSILIGQRRSSPESPCRQEIERSGLSEGRHKSDVKLTNIGFAIGGTTANKYKRSRRKARYTTECKLARYSSHMEWIGFAEKCDSVAGAREGGWLWRDMEADERAAGTVVLQRGGRWVSLSVPVPMRG